MDTEATSRLQLVGPLWGSVWPQRKGQWRKPPLTVISGRRTLTVTLNSTTCSYPSIHLPIPHLAALSAARTHEMKKKWPLLFFFRRGNRPWPNLSGTGKQNKKKSSFFPVIFLLSRLLKRSSREEFLNKEIKPKKLCPPSLSLSLFKQKKKEKNRFIFFFRASYHFPFLQNGTVECVLQGQSHFETTLGDV